MAMKQRRKAQLEDLRLSESEEVEIIGTKWHRLVPVKARVDSEGRDDVLTFTASTEIVARDADVILADGWELENFRANPVILWSHSAWELPIGKSVGERIEKKPEPHLAIDVKFADAEVNPFAPYVQRAYQRGFLHAGSVGYWILGYRVPDADERKELGMGPWGIISTKTELLEFSPVTVPADPKALVKDGRALGEVKEQLLRIGSHLDGRERRQVEKLLGRMEKRGSGGRRKVADALADLRSEVRALRKELRARPARKAPVVAGPADDPYRLLENDIDD